MKKLTSILTACLFVFALTSCDGASEDEVTTTEEGTTEEGTVGSEVIDSTAKAQ